VYNRLTNRFKKRFKEMEGRLQALADMYNKSEIREEYLEHLDQLEGKGVFEDFSDIGELRRRIENAES